MRKKIKLTILLVAVFIVGIIAGLVGSKSLWMRLVIAPSYGASLLEIAIDAQQLSQGKANDVLRRKVDAMPQIARMYHTLFYPYMPEDDSRYAALWQVQKYYKISGDEVTDEIRPILESLPQKPLKDCELKRPEEKASAETNGSEQMND